MPHSRRILAPAAIATAVTLAAATVCVARGTGGFLRQWVVLGPLEGTRLNAPSLPADFAAYPGLFTLDRAWVPAEAEEDGRVDLRTLFPEPRTGTALLHTFFEIPADGMYRLRVGSDDAVRVEVDGRIVHARDVRRAWEPDQDTVKVFLTRGWHRLLVRVVEYGGAWAVSVRVADEKDQPLEVRHQPTVPGPLESFCRLDEAVTMGERADVARFLSAQAERLQSDLQSALPRLAEMPEGYVTFAEYEGARDLGRRFFEAMAAFWQQATSQDWNEQAVRDARRAAVEAARGFSEVLAQETDRIGSRLSREHRVWETLGGEELSRRQLAAATLQVAALLAETRRLATRIENERLLMARFENDIRNFRQRDFRVRVVDPEGATVPDADVEIVQTGHDFLFGCNLFAFRRWDDEKKDAAYERRFRDLFNLAVVPLYWSVVERNRGRPEFGQADAAIRWCRDQRIQVRVHPLVWRETVPRWLDDLDADGTRAAFQAYLDQIFSRYRDKVDFWDVVHQPTPTIPLGGASLDPAEALRLAGPARPRGQLLLNFSDADGLSAIVRRARATGAPLDAIGLEAHQHEGIWPLDMIRKTLDDAAAPGLPVHVSAVTILGRPEDEARQAEAVKHFYTAAFAHPKVASITWWDLSDRFAWRNAPAGLLRADLSPKPAYQALDRLLNHLWRTDAAGRTDAEGKVTVRAFFGQYRITVLHGRNRTTTDVRLTRDGPAEIEIVLPPAK